MSKAESKRKKEGLFQLNEPPEALPVLGENATTTPGGFMSDLRTNLATKLNMDEQKIQQCVGDPSLSLLDAYLGVSTSALFPEKYLKSIIKNFKILLALRHVPPQLIEKVAKTSWTSSSVAGSTSRRPNRRSSWAKAATVFVLSSQDLLEAEEVAGKRAA